MNLSFWRFLSRSPFLVPVLFAGALHFPKSFALGFLALALAKPRETLLAAGCLCRSFSRVGAFHALAFTLVLLFASFPFGPIFDSAKDLALARSPGPLSSLYWGLLPGAPQFNLYGGMSWLWGFFERLFRTPELAAGILRALIFLAFAFPFAKAGANLLEKSPKKTGALILAFLFSLFLAAGGFGKIVQARPDMIALAFLSLGLFCRGAGSQGLWLLAGTLLSPLYWLWPIAALGAFLWPVSLRRRLVGFLLAGSLFSVWWALSTHGAWLGLIFSFDLSIPRDWRSVGELAPLRSLFSWPALFFGFCSLALLSVWTLAKSKALWPKPHEDCALLALAFLFLAVDMARFAPFSAWFLALFCARAIPAKLFFHGAQGASGARVLLTASLCLSLGICSSSFFDARSHSQAPKLPTSLQGKKIFSTLGPETYSIPLHHPGTLMAPSMGVGWNSKEIEAGALDLLKGKIDCAFLIREGAQGVVEQSLAQTSPCLKLEGIDGPRRFWSVVHP